MASDDEPDRPHRGDEEPPDERRHDDEAVDESERESFPASDPPSSWAGRPEAERPNAKARNAFRALG